MSQAVLRAWSVDSLEDRVVLLRKMVFDPHGGVRAPIMRRLGLLATRHCPPRSDACELKAVFDMVVRNVRYTGDVAGKDTFQSAIRTLQYGGGDCDDHSILCATLAMENGFTCKFRISSNQGSSWDHIFVLAGVPKNRPLEWIALDTTLGPSRFGKQPRFVKCRDFLVAPGG